MLAQGLLAIVTMLAAPPVALTVGALGDAARTACERKCKRVQLTVNN